jgi:prephenate dehydratase
VVLLPQCAGFLREHGIEGVVAPRTTPPPRVRWPSGAIPRTAALASELAAEIYGLDVLARHIEDEKHNTTRFLVMSRDARPTGGAARRG